MAELNFKINLEKQIKSVFRESRRGQYCCNYLRTRVLYVDCTETG